MNNVSAIFNRVRELRELVMPEPRPGAFAARLDSALTDETKPGGGPAAPLDEATIRAYASSFLGRTPTVTLGTMMTTLGDPAPAVATTGPAMVMPVTAEAGSRFGMRVDPFTYEQRMHQGIDFGAELGDPIFAAMGGEVVFTGERGGFGNLVIIDHGAGLQTYYAHQSVIEATVGDVVAAGQRIGQIGSTGRSTAPHLHFEVRIDGEAVDPAPYLGVS